MNTPYLVGDIPPPPIRNFALADLPKGKSVSQHAYGCGWEELDAILKFYPGQLIVLSGIAGHGKSTFILNIIAKLACEKDIGCFLHVPENERNIEEKMQLLWPGSEDEFRYFRERQCTVMTSLPQEGYNEPAHTISFVLHHARYAVEYERREIVLIDPWNELDRAREKNEMMTDYIGRCLMEIKDFCRTSEAIVVVVAHPTKGAVSTSKDNGQAVTLADIEGSMNWYNKCDNGLIIVRKDNSNTAKVISAKVREIGAGKTGSCSFYVDPKTGKFSPQYGSDSDATQEEPELGLGFVAKKNARTHRRNHRE